VRRGSDRRRYAAAYAWSIFIHAVALVLVVLYVLHALLAGTASDASLEPDTTIAVIPPSPAPTHAPTAPPPPPAPRRIARVPVPPPPHHELARLVPRAPSQPSAAPVPTTAPATPAPRRIARVMPLPTAAPTQQPTLVPQPSAAPTARPIPEATARPTPEATERPTPQPTVAPTAAPTLPPTPAPTVPPTAAATAAPTERPTAAPTERPASAPTARPTSGPKPGAAPSPGNGGARSANPTARPGAAVAPAAVSPTGSPAAGGGAPGPATPLPERSASPSLAALNDRLRAALPTGPAGGYSHVDLGGGYRTSRVLDAYEAALAPPLEILLKTFGLIYTSRTAAHADSIAYVYERTRVLGVEVCRAYTIVEHPLRVPGPNADHIGPVSAPTLPGPLPDLKPEITTETVPCNAKGMIPVAPGSMTSPAPRHPDLASPSPAP